MAVTNRAVFFDKDGTLVRDVPYNVDPARIVLADGAGHALAALQAADFRLVVVSNQSGVGRGLFAEDALAGVETRLRELLAGCGVELAAFAYCPHLAEAGCACRKPRPGLITQAAETLAVDTSDSWMVGDILDDVEAGARAGCRTVLLDVGGETEWRAGPFRRPDFVVPGLRAAARAILSAGTQRVAA